MRCVLSYSSKGDRRRRTKESIEVQERLKNSEIS